MDPHQFDADPDTHSDSTYHPDADPDSEFFFIGYRYILFDLDRLHPMT